jgi:hypothetical protein
MPRMDGTGPAGAGPMTGRGMGVCGVSGVNSSRTPTQRPTSWIGRLFQGTIGSFGSYRMARIGGRGMRAGRGQGRRRTF